VVAEYTKHFWAVSRWRPSLYPACT
jgi:hypothetical protein